MQLLIICLSQCAKERITTTQLLVNCLQRKPRPFVLLFFCPKKRKRYFGSAQYDNIANEVSKMK